MILSEPTDVFPPRVLTKAKWPPNYTKVMKYRQRQGDWISVDQKARKAALKYYENHCSEFIMHWCDTTDPRNSYSEVLPTRLPFVLFERQDDLVTFLLSCLGDQANGLIDKSRDMGATWICVAVSVWLWRFRKEAAIGWGSRKEELVDRIGDPKSIF